MTPTPEGVSLDVVLAGLGSRLAAFSVDFTIQVASFIVVAIVVVVAIRGGGASSELVAAGVLSLVALVDFIGYFVLCEMLWSGRSVGKRAAGTRVVRMAGTPVGFWSSLLRNLARLVDMLPTPLYLVGSVLVLCTSNNQRLGDLLGDTMVIRERHAAVTVARSVAYDDPAQWRGPAAGVLAGQSGGRLALPPELAQWDVERGERSRAHPRPYVSRQPLGLHTRGPVPTGGAVGPTPVAARRRTGRRARARVISRSGLAREVHSRLSKRAVRPERAPFAGWSASFDGSDGP